MMTQTRRRDTTIKIPWRAWHGDEELGLRFPGRWDVQALTMADGSDMSERAIRRALAFPIGGPSLEEIASGKGSAVVVVDDTSRPTPAHRLLPAVLRVLKRAGISAERTRIIMSLGAHRPMLRDDLIKKLGEEAWNSVEIHNHHPYGDLVRLGVSSRGTPICINRLFTEAEVRIGIGCIVPHCYAGFGGGGKIVLPGISGIETLQANHQPATKGLKGGMGVVDGNAVRDDIEEIAQKAGLQLIINAVVTSRRGIAGLFVGDPIKAHRAGVEAARKVYTTRIPPSVDVAVLNAYPKDTELFQASLALDFMLSAPGSFVRPDGAIVISTASPEGGGFHSLEGLGMKLFGLHDRFPSVQTILGERQLCVYCPSVSEYEVKKYYSPSVAFFQEWGALIDFLRQRYPDRCQVGVVPCASIQLAACS